MRNERSRFPVQTVAGITLVLALTMSGGCSESQRVGEILEAGTGDAKEGVFFDGTSGACSANSPCPEGQVCYEGTCVVDLGPCADDDRCQSDSFCHEGHCVAYGDRTKTHDPTCEREVPIGIFAPTKQCAWPGDTTGFAHPKKTSVVATTLVVDFDFDDNPATHRPSIVAISYDGAVGDRDLPGVIRVIDGETCVLQHTLDAELVRSGNPPALGDIDQDGRPEIVAYRFGGGLVAYRYDPQAAGFTKLWTSEPANLGGRDLMLDGPAIHDLDDDGLPEILTGGTVWDSGGKLVDGALILFSYFQWSLFSVAADLDGDGLVEISNGASVWHWKDERWTPKTSSLNLLGQVAVADFGTFGTDPGQDRRDQLDGIAEIAVVSSKDTSSSAAWVRVQTLEGRVVFGPVPLFGSGGFCPPTIGDFDADGRVEIAAVGSGGVCVFDPDCIAGASANVCHNQRADGILWCQSAAESNWGETGTTVFDFDGDGAAEVVYGDVCFSRIYEGKTGEVLYSHWRSSWTANEGPVVADVDGDDHAELLVSSNIWSGLSNYCNASRLEVLPQTGTLLDPLYKGLRCKKNDECLGGSCNNGFCRCTSDAECGEKGLVCGPPLPETPGSGQVCRAAHLGQMGGVLVYRDSRDRWVGSRRIWNQHAYAVTHVNEDGTIPRTSDWKQNWRQPGLNNFRQNVQGTAEKTIPGADLTARWADRIDVNTACDSLWVLIAEICNRGPAKAPAKISGTFYRGDPAAGGEKICTGVTTEPLEAGACTEVRCEWKDPTTDEIELWFIADDDGGGSAQIECRENNNGFFKRGACPMGPD